MNKERERLTHRGILRNEMKQNGKPINSTMFASQTKGNIAKSRFLNDTKNIHNITVLSNIISSKYGCILNTTMCLESSGVGAGVDNNFFMMVMVLVIIALLAGR